MLLAGSRLSTGRWQDTGTGICWADVFYYLFILSNRISNDQRSGHKSLQARDVPFRSLPTDPTPRGRPADSRKSGGACQLPKETQAVEPQLIRQG